MKYTRENLLKVCKEFWPYYTFEKMKGTLSLPKIIDISIIKMWGENFFITEEERVILSKAYWDIYHEGYFRFEEGD